MTRWLLGLGVLLLAIPGSAQRQETLTYRGICVDAAANVSDEIEWVSDQQGLVGVGKSGTMYLKPGRHVITVICRDASASLAVQANRAVRSGIGVALSSAKQFSVFVESTGG